MPSTPLLADNRPPPGNSWVLPEHRMVYMSVTKAACSSLRWMIADLVGEDFDRFYQAPGNHETRLMTIHARRDLWQHSPQIKNTPPDVLSQISRDNGWFIFAVVRDPWSRLWSAWQSKLLTRHASYVENYGREPWFPRVPESGDDVLDDWRTFVRAKPWESHPGLSKDPHFMPQVASVHPTRINYSRIYDLSELDELTRDIHAHLTSVGRDKRLYLPRANIGSLSLRAECLADGVAETIHESYRRDFEQLGERWNLDGVRTGSEPWTQDAIHAVVYHGLANERIGDLSKELYIVLRQLGAAERKLERERPLLPVPARRVFRGVQRRVRARLERDD